MLIYIYIYIEFILFEIKVPIVFLDMVGFSLRRDRRYTRSKIGLGAPSKATTTMKNYEIRTTPWFFSHIKNVSSF